MALSLITIPFISWVITWSVAVAFKWVVKASRYRIASYKYSADGVYGLMFYEVPFKLLILFTCIAEIYLVNYKYNFLITDSTLTCAEYHLVFLALTTLMNIRTAYVNIGVHGRIQNRLSNLLSDLEALEYDMPEKSEDIRKVLNRASDVVFEGKVYYEFDSHGRLVEKPIEKDDKARNRERALKTDYKLSRKNLNMLKGYIILLKNLNSMKGVA